MKFQHLLYDIYSLNQDPALSNKKSVGEIMTRLFIVVFSNTSWKIKLKHTF